MATFVGEIKNRQIIFITWISISGVTPSPNPPNSFNSLLDTGAQVTMISQRVASSMALQAIGHMQCYSSDWTANSNPKIQSSNRRSN